MIKIRGIYEENGYTKVRIWLRSKLNADGTENKPYRRSFGPYNMANIQRAKNHIDEVRAQFRPGQPLPQEIRPVGVAEVSEIYFKRHWLEKTGRSADAIRNARYGLKRFRKYWPAQAWDAITPQAIEQYARDRKAAGIKIGTINRELALLSSMFSMMIHWSNRREIGPYLLPTDIQGHLYNPAEFVERESDALAKRQRVASDEEVMKVIEYCRREDPDMLIVIKRAMLTGLRMEDLRKVNGLKDVRGVLSKTSNKKLFSMPLDFSQIIDYTNHRGRWDAVRKACDMMDFHWHDWRATSGTMLAKLGFTIEEIRQFYGHATIQQTMDYIRLGENKLKPHVSSLGGHLSKLEAALPPVAETIQDPTKKVCRGCGLLLPLTHYPRHSAFASGIDSRCKQCNYKRVKARRAIPGARTAEYFRRKYANPTGGNDVSKTVSN